MKKRLATLATLGVMAWWLNAWAQSESIKIETNKNLITTISNQEQVSSENDMKTISFEDIAKQSKNKKLKEEVMDKITDNENYKQLIKQYWQENVDKVLDELLEIISDEKFQEAMNKKNEEEIKQIIKTALKERKKEYRERVEELFIKYLPYWLGLGAILRIAEQLLIMKKMKEEDNEETEADKKW